MSRISKAVLAAIIAVPLFAGVAVAKEQTLYQRLGGYDAIVAVTDDFLGRLVTSETFARFFVGFSTDSKARIRQHIVEFVCQATGGPCIYTGRDMKTAHGGIGITKAEWDASVAAFAETMKALKVPEAEQKDLAALILPLEKDIVEKP